MKYRSRQHKNHVTSSVQSILVPLMAMIREDKRQDIADAIVILSEVEIEEDEDKTTEIN